MATQTIQVEALSGETLTMEVFSLTSDTVQASASATEATNRHGLYVASFTDLPVGSHRCMMVDASNEVSSVQYCTTTAATETVQSYDSLSGISGTIDANIVSADSDFVVNANIVSSTVSAEAIVTGLVGNTITQLRGDSWSIQLSNLGNLTGYSNLWFTVKRSKNDKDTESWIQIDVSSGLKYINGSEAGTPANGSVTVTDAATGAITVVLAPEESAKLPAKSGFYDIQLKNSSNAIQTVQNGEFSIEGDVTLVTS
jgi:hypothetical protein